MAQLDKDSAQQGVHQDGTTKDEHTILQDLIKDVIALNAAIVANGGAGATLLSSNQS